MLPKKIQAIPVEVLMFKDVLSTVQALTLKDFPEIERRAREDQRFQNGKRTEGEDETIFVWTPAERCPTRDPLFKSPWSARPKEHISDDGETRLWLRPIDCDAIRDAFLEIENTRAALLFFRLNGIFGEEHRNLFNYLSGLSFHDLHQWQEVFRDCWLSKPRDWHAIAERNQDLRGISDILRVPEFSLGLRRLVTLRLRCDSVREAILASILLEKLRDLKSSMCHRPDCGKVFSHTSNHNRKYCRSECAHLEAVRRHRAREKRG